MFRDAARRAEAPRCGCQIGPTDRQTDRQNKAAGAGGGGHWEVPSVLLGPLRELILHQEHRGGRRAEKRDYDEARRETAKRSDSNPEKKASWP